VNNTSTPHAFIETRDLCKFYPETQAKALDNVNLIIQKGDFISITGPSGSGKTTLLNIISGLIEPSTGDVYYHGKSLRKISDRSLFRKKNIGFVFQDFYLYPNFTVLENVLLPESNRWIMGRALTEKAKRLLSYVSMDGLSRRKVNTLSTGERQRVSIARALLNNPGLIIADEPTGNLDSKNSMHVMKLFEKINIEHHTTILLVTHDETVASFGKKRIHIRDGAAFTSPNDPR